MIVLFWKHIILMAIQSVQRQRRIVLSSQLIYPSYLVQRVVGMRLKSVVSNRAVSLSHAGEPAQSEERRRSTVLLLLLSQLFEYNAWPVGVLTQRCGGWSRQDQALGDMGSSGALGSPCPG